MTDVRIARIALVALAAGALFLAACGTAVTPEGYDAFRAQQYLTGTPAAATAAAQARATDYAGGEATRQARQTADAASLSHAQAVSAMEIQSAQIAETRVSLAERMAALDVTRTLLPLETARREREIERMAVWTWTPPILAGVLVLGLLGIAVLRAIPVIRDRAAVARSNELQAELAGAKIVDGVVIVADDAALTVRRVAAGLSEAIPIAPTNDGMIAAYVDGWGRALEMFTGWLAVLPRESRTRDAMEQADIVSAHGWNTLIECLRRMGAVERDGKVYRPVLDRAEVRARAVQVIPRYDRDHPAMPPDVAPVVRSRSPAPLSAS